MSATAARAVAALLAVVCAAAFGCGVECDAPYQCDIRDASCQQQVLTALQCVRGGERGDVTAHVPVRVVDADRYQQEQLAMIEPSDADATRLWYRGLALLDLASDELDLAGATEVELGNVAAFYDPDERAVTVLDRGGRVDGVGAVNVLAHELVHAQQDQEHGFDALSERYGDTLDSWLGLIAITEGEAELYSSQLTANALGFARDDVHWADALEYFRASSRKDAAASGNPLLELRANFVYSFGTSYVYAAFEAGGREGVAALYEHPPVSSRQVIQGFGASPPGGKPWVEPELAELAVPQLEAFPRYVDGARYGAYAFEIALAHWRGADRPGERAVIDPTHPTHPTQVAASLRADELTVQSNDDGDVVVSWRLRFASARTAQDAYAAIEPWVPRQPQLVVLDRDVFLIAASSDALSAVELEQVTWSPVPPEPESDTAEPAAAFIEGQPIRCRPTPVWR